MEKPIEKQLMLPQNSLLQGGKYRVERLIASGGFGNTYEVNYVEFGERMAMKEFFIKGICERDVNSTTVSVSNMLNKSQFKSQKEKFKKEARRLRKLRNEHIVRVHDLFEENGTAYYVMDYVDGESLEEQLKRTGMPLKELELRRILIQVLDALETVHSQLIWHLDLKPGNIMINRQGEVRLIDFGASKQMDLSDGLSTMTTAMCYTPGYAPLEQLDQKMDYIGPWTDLYALGASIYRLLTGNMPPMVSDIEEDDSLFYPEDVSDGMRELVRWMMTPRRQKRPQSVEEVRQFLEKLPEPVEQTEKDSKSGDADEVVVVKVVEGDKNPEEDTILGTDTIISEDSSAINRIEESNEDTIVASNDDGVLPEISQQTIVAKNECSERSESEAVNNRSEDVVEERTVYSVNEADNKLKMLSTHDRDSEKPHTDNKIIDNRKNDNVISPQKSSSAQNNRSESFIRNRKFWMLVPLVIFISIIELPNLFKECKGKEPIPKDTIKVDPDIIKVKNVKKVTKQYDSPLGKCIYNGPVDEKQLPHGIGKATFNDGRLYEGPFEHGQMSGDSAYFRFDNGDTFRGAFRNNLFHEGRYTVKEDGSYFIGTFKNGQPDKGEWYDKENRMTESTTNRSINENRSQQKLIEQEKAQKAKKEKEEAEKAQRKAKEAAEKAVQARQQAAEKAKAKVDAKTKSAPESTPTLHVDDHGSVKVVKPAAQGKSAGGTSFWG